MFDMIQKYLNNRVSKGTAAQWAASTSIIPDGIMCVETDTNKAKVGNGTSTYAQLAYEPESSGGYGNTLAFTARDSIIAGQFVALRNAETVEDITAVKGNVQHWIGAARNNANDGDRVLVDVFGGVNSNQFDLKMGFVYYLDDDGELTETVGSYRVGRALSATEILIEGSGIGMMEDLPAPLPPTHESPTAGEAGTLTTPVLRIAGFNNGIDVHTNTQFQVSTTSDFTSVLYDSGELTSVLQVTVSAGANLLEASTYYWRARWRGQFGGWSAYSTPTSFQTGAAAGYQEWLTPGTYTFTVPTGVVRGRIRVVPDAIGSKFGSLVEANTVPGEPTGWSFVDSSHIGTKIYHGSATDQLGRIYVVGGGTAAAYRLDPDANTWETIAPLSESRTYHTVVSGADGKIYAIGGSVGSDATTNIVECYNPSTNTWTVMAPMAMGRSNHSSVVDAQGRIYVIGGFNSVGGVVGSVERYDPTTNTWSLISSMSLSVARRDHSSVIDAQGRIYVIGGRSGVSGQVLSSVERYDFNTNSWASVQPMPRIRAWHTSAVDSAGRIYAIAGGNGTGGASSILNHVDRYNPITNVWESVASLSVTRYHHSSAVDKYGRVYVIGGQTGAGITGSVERLNFSVADVNFTGHDGTYDADGFNISTPETSIGTYGTTAKKMCWSDATPLTPGTQHQIVVGSSKGAVRIDWGPNVPGEVKRFTAPGNYTWKIPQSVTSTRLTVIPDETASSFGTLLTSTVDGENVNFAGADNTLTGNGFNIDNSTITSPGSYGTTSKSCGIASNVAVTPDTFTNVVVGSATGAVMAEWGSRVLPTGRAIFTTPGTHTWTVPAGVTSAKVTAVPDTNSSSFGIILSGSRPSWTATAASAASLHSRFALVADDTGHIYHIGGTTPVYGMTDVGWGIIDHASIENIFSKTNTTDGTKTTLVGPYAAADVGAVFNNEGYIYVTGGVNQGGTPVNTARRYSITNDTWTTLATLPSARVSHAMGVDGSHRVYVIGGTINSNTINTVLRYNVSTNTWESVASLNVSRRDFSAVTDSNGNIYAVGGTGVGGIALNTIERYNPSNNTWTILSTTIPIAYGLSRAVIFNDNIYILSGWNGTTTFNRNMYIYSITANTISEHYAQYASGRRSAGVVISNGVIYHMYGYGGGSQFLANYERIDLRGNFSGHDTRISGNGFDINATPVTSPGSFGVNSQVAGIKWGVPLTPGDQHTITVGSTTGAVRIDWGPDAHPTGEAVFTTPGTYNWTVPAGVTSVSAVAVGGGASGGSAGGDGGCLRWGTFNVTPGQSITITVGSGGLGSNGNGLPGGSTSVGSLMTAYGGIFSPKNTVSGVGGQGGGIGGQGGSGGGSGTGDGIVGAGGGGGGAGGYAGNGGYGGVGGSSAGNNGLAGGPGSGGGAGGGGGHGGSLGTNGYAFGGGGIGIYGQGSNGTGGLGTTGSVPGTPGTGGSGGTSGQAGNGTVPSSGGQYGGGGGGTGYYVNTTPELISGAGGHGAVRIIWGVGRSYPNNAT